MDTMPAASDRRQRHRRASSQGGLVRAFFRQQRAAAEVLATAGHPRIAGARPAAQDTAGRTGGRLGLWRPRRAVAAIKPSMGSAWRETAVAIVTEFGRTARQWHRGHDHASAPSPSSPARARARVIADWPGLRL
jgi:uncharacterized protein (DUF1501 family)